MPGFDCMVSGLVSQLIISFLHKNRLQAMNRR